MSPLRALKGLFSKPEEIPEPTRHERCLRELKRTLGESAPMPSIRSGMTRDGREVRCCGATIVPAFTRDSGRILEVWQCPCGNEMSEAFPLEYVGSDRIRGGHRIPGNPIIQRWPPRAHVRKAARA